MLEEFKEACRKAQFYFLTGMLFGRTLTEAEMIILYEIMQKSANGETIDNLSEFAKTIERKYKNSSIPKTYAKLHGLIKELTEVNIAQNVGKLIELGILTEKEVSGLPDKVTLIEKHEEGHKKVIEATEIGKRIFEESIKYQRIIKDYVEARLET